MENILNAALPYIVTVIGGYLTAQIVKIIPSVISYIKAKVGVVNYNKLKAVAHDIFDKIEEDARIGELANNKIDAFNELLKKQFPCITDDEINIVRQAISHEINKDKEPIQKAIENIEPTIQPVEATITTQTSADTNTPSPIINDPIKGAVVNEEILNQIKELMSKLQ